MQVLRKIFWIKVVLCFFIHYAKSAARIDALVDAKVGLIRGLYASDGDYAMFLGIPYAKVTEDNPFGPSVPFPLFDETFEAYNDSAICPQINNDGTGTVIGSLDCLHLNVYVPNTASSKNRLPVMVWIHGGAFIVGNFGRTSFGPRNLVKHDVILVTLNYRLGPYGFMCLDTPKVPGNQGLKDQQLALKWIKENIEAFGGDANSVTIFGQSDGALSVDLHLYYTKEKLFNKVILQSGNALCPWAIKNADRTVPTKIAKHLGFESNHVDEILSFLSMTTPDLVIAASNELNLDYIPCVEKDFENVDKFIGEFPINTNIETDKDFPILIGHNYKESLGILHFDIDLLQNIFHENLMEYFNFDNEKFATMVRYIRNFYIGDETITELNAMSIVDFSSDFNFNHPVKRSINRYVENGAKSVFYYVFSYVGNQNLSLISSEWAFQGNELNYLFNQVPGTNNISLSDQTMIDQITTLWTNFAKTGNPTPEESDLIPLIWTPVTRDSLNYLNIGSEVSVKRRPFHDRMAFWDLFYKLNEKAQKGFTKI